jgi:hypothetical protein
MKNISLVLLGAALSAGVLLASSAGAPPAPQGSTAFRAGGSVFGLNLVSGNLDPLAGATPGGAVSIRAVKGDWIQIDYPSMKNGPTWVNVNNIVSYRTGR